MNVFLSQYNEWDVVDAKEKCAHETFLPINYYYENVNSCNQTLCCILLKVSVHFLCIKNFLNL